MPINSKIYLQKPNKQNSPLNTNTPKSNTKFHHQTPINVKVHHQISTNAKVHDQTPINASLSSNTNTTPKFITKHQNAKVYHQWPVFTTACQQMPNFTIRHCHSLSNGNKHLYSPSNTDAHHQTLTHTTKHQCLQSNSNILHHTPSNTITI